MHSLAVSHISKHYSRKKALDDVSLSFETGSVYALLGENGAGKSTLASLLSGDAEPTTGGILLDGQPVSFRSPHDAISSGITMVRQQPLLADELSVLENCILGNEKTGAAGSLKKQDAAAELEEIQRAWFFLVLLSKKAGTLTAPERFFASLLANLYKKPRFLLLDEPSATLDEEQRKKLFTTLRDKAHQEDICIIFITHNIQEALDYADTITILQKGRVVYSEDITQEKPAISDIADKLFARKESRGFTFAAAQADRAAFISNDTPMLELRNVTVRPDEGAALFNINFSVPKGALTCIKGQRESGLDTLEDLITGMLDTADSRTSFRRNPSVSGTICFNGTELSTPLTPRFLRQHETAIIPFRKMIRGSHPELTVAELLGSTGADPESILKQVQTDIIPHEKVKALSGGMLQRLIIARELFSNPSFVIMSSPSYGLDRFSTGKIAETIAALLSQGITVLVLGDEPELCAAQEGAPLCTHSYELVAGHLVPCEPSNTRSQQVAPSQQATPAARAESAPQAQTAAQDAPASQKGAAAQDAGTTPGSHAQAKSSKQAGAAAQDAPASKASRGQAGRLRSRLASWCGPLFAIATGLIAATLIILFTADSPAATLTAFFKAPFSSTWYTGRMLNTASLLLLAALGSLLSLHSGELNLGGEGQVYAGGFVTALFLNAVWPAGSGNAPGSAGIVLIMIATCMLAALTGALLTLIPELLSLFRKIPVLLSTFLLSAACIPLIDDAIARIVKKTGSNLLSTPQISSAFRFTRLLPPSQLNTSALIILALSAIVLAVLFTTRSGEIFRICGLAPEYALYSGFHLKTNRAAGLLLSGAFHGMTGFFAVTGTYFACQNGFYSGMGWNAVTVALIAQSAPELLIPAVLILSWLFTASESVVLTGTISGDITSIIQAIVLLTITVRFIKARRHS